ncbi:hypothetical protein FH972_023805 [Carpinus fangiana]|uniref:Arf-GAP domain-containing protein n=1 Tax=Carpinus fangiana TaxID=176857 RepID=A0A5N6KW93_9ROSI|nr:hypothetical protein FH972_023805 [Carpinus fangiana]
MTVRLTSTVWQWDQLRIMKVGGNESATKYFQTHGGSAALASKDPKTKYCSTAATKYKDELTRRVAADAAKYPGEVDVTDVVGEENSSNGTTTPAKEGDDDFFSSWDKPTIKRPSNPPSRTGTPAQAGRASPFLNPGTNGNGARPKSPLNSTETGPKVVQAAAVRKSTPIGGTAAKKSNILGAKKNKLGAKKIVSGGDDLDFEAAEKKAREEAERIEKLGYDPDAEEPPTTSATPIGATQIASPTPISPGSGGFGATNRHIESADPVPSMARLGFGQVGSGPKTAAAPRKMGGFGSTGRAVEADTDKTARDKFGQQKGISSDEFFGRNNYDPSQQAEAKNRLQGFEGATSISSNAYFGRPDEELEEEYGDLETAAKDFVRKFGITAGDDLENVSALVGEGATRLAGTLSRIL